MSSDSVHIQAEVPVADELLEQLASAVQVTLRRCEAPPAASMALLLTDDRHIRQLNLTYLGHDEATDVLSFPAGEAMPGMDQKPAYLGDIVIAVPYATRQAQAGGHAPAAEMQLLAVHGTLHLLGHDHGEPDEKRRMWQIQSDVLLELGIPHVNPPGSAET